MWASFAEGERLLQKQRYTLPADWLLVSNLEGELNAVEQAASKRNSDMTARVPALRTQVSVADASLTDAINAYIADWERDRWVPFVLGVWSVGNKWLVPSDSGGGGGGGGGEVGEWGKGVELFCRTNWPLLLVVEGHVCFYLYFSLVG
jgi:hypothetical protein